MGLTKIIHGIGELGGEFFKEQKRIEMVNLLGPFHGGLQIQGIKNLQI